MPFSVVTDGWKAKCNLLRGFDGEVSGGKIGAIAVKMPSAVLDA